MFITIIPSNSYDSIFFYCISISLQKCYFNFNDLCLIFMYFDLAHAVETYVATSSSSYSLQNN